MIKKIIKKITKRLDYSDYLELAVSFIEQQKDDGRLNGVILNSPEWTSEWIEYIKPDLKRLPNNQSKKNHFKLYFVK